MVVAVASGAKGGPRQSTTGRRVYRQSQSESALTSAPAKQIASFVVPAGVFFAGTFGMETSVVSLVFAQHHQNCLIFRNIME